MRSKISLFSGTLYGKNLTRFWPIWGLGLAIWTFRFPVNFLLLAPQNYYGDAINPLTYFAETEVLGGTSVALIYALIFGLLAAMAVFSYLYSNRSAGMMHALPLKREGLFLTGYLSGLTMVAGPLVVTFFTTLAAEAALGAVNAGALCMWLVVSVLLAVFFYSFAVFCAMFTGHILALPVFYGVLNILAVGVFTVLDALLRQFLYGYNDIPWLSDLANVLTPVAFLEGRMYVQMNWVEEVLESVTFRGLAPALCYAGVGILLAVAALILYRRRKLESAGDVVSAPWVRPVFKYGVAACAALAGGFLLYYYFFRGSYENNLFVLLACALPCGAIGYFAAEMLLKKSFRVFGAWKGCLAILVALAAGLGVVRMDPFGFGRWMPQAGEIASVTVRNVGYSPNDGYRGDAVTADEEGMALALEIHRALVEGREAIEGGVEETQQTDAVENDYLETSGINSILLLYELKDGSTATRRYRYPVSEAMLDDPDSYASKIEDYISLPHVVREGYFRGTEKMKLVMATLQVYDTETDETVEEMLPSEGLEPLLAAVSADLDAGRLGRRYLLDNLEQQKACYQFSLNLGFFSPDQTEVGGADRRATPTLRSEAEQEISSNVNITIQTTATETIAELTRQGILDETHTLVTEYEWRERDEMDQ